MNSALKVVGGAIAAWVIPSFACILVLFVALFSTTRWSAGEAATLLNVLFVGFCFVMLVAQVLATWFATRQVAWPWAIGLFLGLLVLNGFSLVMFFIFAAVAFNR